MKLKSIFFQHAVFLLGILTTLNANAQVKIGTNPTVIEPANNLEVEAATSGRKVKVDKTSGQLTIKDGTEGLDKILTSDAAGGASWKTPATLKIDQTVFVGRQVGYILLLQLTTLSTH